MVYKIPQDVPDDFARYAKLNPAYVENEAGQLNDPRARKELLSLSHKEGSGKVEDLRTAAQMALKVILFQHAIREKIQQIATNYSWGKKGGPATAAEFKATPRTFVKTAQEVLVHPTDRMAFDRSDDQATALYDIVIDPRLISDSLLQNLGLSEFIIEGRASREDRQIRRAEAIPAIRDILGRLEPIRLPHQRETDVELLRYFRLMRVGTGLNEGYVVGTQNIGDRKIMFKSDIYAAERRIAHISKDYDKELDLLVTIKVELERFRDDLEKWAVPSMEAELNEKRKKMGDIFESLKFMTEDNKKVLKRRVMQCMTFEDSRSRQNPRAKMALLTGSVNSIGKRIEDVSDISRELGKDRVLAKTMIQEQIAPMRKFYETVQELHDEFSIFHPQIPLSDLQKAKIIRNLNEVKKDASTMVFEPDLSFGRKFIAQIDKTIDDLMAGDNQLAAKEFLKMYLIVKIKKAHVRLNSFYRDISVNPETLQAGPAINRLIHIREELEKKGVAPGISTNEYDAAYGRVYHLLRSLTKRLVELKDDKLANHVKERALKIIERNARQAKLFPAQDSAELTANAEKMAVIEIMKKRMDEFSFEELLKNV